MLNIYQLEETWHSLKQHKNRNLLTGFGVAWGIFILVLLVGAGEGLQKGIMVLFQDYTQNSIWVYGGQTTMSKPGQSEGRDILFEEQDITIISHYFEEIKHISPEVVYNGQKLYSKTKSHKRFSCYGVNSKYFNIKTFSTSKGRLLNPNDENRKANVAVIGEKIATGLFGKSDPIGQHFCLDGIWLKVIGTLEEKSLFSDNQNHIYIPFSTLKAHFNNNHKFDCFALALNKGAAPDKFEETLVQYLSKKFQFSQTDDNAIYIDNLQTDAKTFTSLFKIIKGFLWLVGICMLLTGIVGVSNIMLVVVKERTQEIGIRKAIGAKPQSILLMILAESVVITLVAGLVGLLSASGLMSLINAALGSMIMDKSSIFKGLDINFTLAIGALILLVVSGAVAGLYPAQKAASVMPIKALSSNE